MTRIRAAVCRAFGEPLSVEEVELREPGEGEVGVRIAACAICHSDVAFLDGVWGGELPAVYGHEAAGVVEELGDGCDGLARGDHVVVTLVRACGRCAMCVRGLPAQCVERAAFPLSVDSPLRGSDGSPITQGLKTAAFAERVTVHASQAVAIDADIPLDVAALLACGVLTGVGAVVNTAGVEPGATVGVIGTGGVGLNSVQGAALADARIVVAIDLVPAKLDAARTFGATHGVEATGDVAEEVRRLTDGRGLDYVVVTAGSASAVELALEIVADAGAVVLVGMPGGATVAIDPEVVADRSLRILGSKLGDARPQADIPMLVDLYLNGHLKLGELVSGRFPLEEINDAIAHARSGEALRPVVVV